MPLLPPLPPFSKDRAQQMHICAKCPLKRIKSAFAWFSFSKSGAIFYYTCAEVRFCQVFASAGIFCYTCALRLRPIRTKKPLFLALLCPAPCKSGLIAPGGLYKFLRILSTFAPFGLLEFRTVGEWGGVKRDTFARVFELFKFPGGSRISPGNSHICPASSPISAAFRYL